MPGNDSIQVVRTGYMAVGPVRYYTQKERKAAFEKISGQQGRLGQKTLPTQRHGTPVRLPQKTTSQQNSGAIPVFGKPPKNVKMMPTMIRVNRY